MSTFALFNDIKRTIRTSRLEGEGATTIFGDVKFDLTKAQLEPGDHAIRFLSLFGDIKLRVPEYVGIAVDADVLFGELEIETLSEGEEEKPGANWVSENYQRANVRIHIHVQGVFGDIDVIRVPGTQITSAPYQITTAADVPDSMQNYEGETRKLRRE